MHSTTRKPDNLFIDSGAVDDDEIDWMVDGAYADNLAEGRVVTPEFVDDTARSALAAQLDEMEPYEEEFRWPELDGYSAECITLFEHAFSETHKLFKNTGLKVPDPSDFMMDGVDLEELTNKYVEMEEDNQNPMLVVAPITVDRDVWQKVYDRLKDDKSIINNPLKAGMVITEKEDGDLGLNNQRTRSEMVGKLRPVGLISKPGYGGIRVVWSIRIIPQATRFRPQDHSISMSYPTISEYLAVQGRRICAGEKPLGHYYWLEGSTDEPSRQPYGTWFPNNGSLAVVIASVERDSRGVVLRPEW